MNKRIKTLISHLVVNRDKEFGVDSYYLEANVNCYKDFQMKQAMELKSFFESLGGQVIIESYITRKCDNPSNVKIAGGKRYLPMFIRLPRNQKTLLTMVK